MNIIENHDYFMKQAYNEALKALDANEVPIGAVIVDAGKIIGRGYNQIEALNDPSAHAEVIAIGAASSHLKTWRLNDCILYVTLEPCLMCLGAILQSRIDYVVFGATDSRFGAMETTNYHEKAYSAYRRWPQFMGGIRGEECRELIQDFFKSVRKK